MKTVKLLTAVLLLVAVTAMAQNALQVENFTLPQNGGDIAMTLTLDEADKYVSYQFKIQTPTGVAYVAGTVIENGCLFLNSSKFWYSVGSTKIKAFRAYFNFDDLLPDFEDNYAEAPVLISFDDGLTGIGLNAKGETTDDNVIYNLNGQRVETPKKGLYIINNKKVVVK